MKVQVACENIRFSSLFVAKDVSRGGETSPAAKSEKKRMFSQAKVQASSIWKKKMDTKSGRLVPSRYLCVLGAVREDWGLGWGARGERAGSQPNPQSSLIPKNP